MRSRVLVVLVSVALVPAASLASGAGASASRAPSAAQAPAPGWVTVSGPVHSSAHPGLARLDGQLQVVWSQTDGSTRSIRSRLLAPNGRIASAESPVITGWPAIVNDPKVIGPAATRRVVFAGIHPNDFSSYTGPAVFAESANGATWTLGTGSLSKSTAAGSDGEIAALDSAGIPFFAKGGFSGGVIVHRGLDPQVPAAADDLHATELEGAPVEVELARDRSTDDVYVAWYSLGATDDDEAGTFVQRMWPQPNGPLLKAPGSSDGGGNSIGPGQPVALAERAGGGVWLAYRVGYPTSNTIRLWRVGAPSFLTISSGAKIADKVCLATATQGRLWLTWRTVSDHVLHVARTNKAVTRFGPVQNIVQPGGLSSSVHRSECEGSQGPLSLVVNAQVVGDEPRLYARRVLPPLSASRRPGRLNKGTVTVTVKDAGDAVPGAKVRFRGRTFTTSARGKATFSVGKAVPSKRYTIAVSKPGYAPTSLALRVT